MKKLVLAVTVCLLTFSLNVFAQDMVLDANGNIGMGILNPDHGLHIAGINDSLHLEGTNEFDNYSGARLSFGDLGYTYIEETSDDLLTIKTSNLSFLADTIGFGVYPATVKLDISSSNGYEQLRLRTSYTPTSSNDVLGLVGSITWDNNYLYIRTPTGWKRAALSSW